MSELSDYLSEFEAAAPKPTQPSKPGLVQMEIRLLQSLLQKLGDKLTQDGAFGPATRTLWQKQAAKYKLDPAFDRASPTSAWVAQPTYAGLSSAAYPTAGVPAPKPVATAPTKAKAAPRAAAPVAASAPKGTVSKSVLELQTLLYGVGWTEKKLTKDGTYGPQTKKAWGVSAKLRKLPETFERVNGQTALVNQATYDKIKADGGKTTVAPTPAPAPGPVPYVPGPQLPAPQAGTINRSVEELQKLLHGIGWTKKKVALDKKFGPATKSAWATSAKTRKLPELFERVDPLTAKVSEVTYLKISADAKLAPVPAPYNPPVPPGGGGGGATPPALQEALEKPVAEVQKLLHQKPFSWKTTTVPSTGTFSDGLVKAWTTSASSRKLNPYIEKVNNKTVRVHAATYAAFLTLSGKKVAPAPTPAPTPGPAPAPAPDAPAGSRILKVVEMQDIVHRLGVKKTKATSDGKFGPATQKAWETVAAIRKLDSGVTGKAGSKTAAVSDATYLALRAAADKKPAPAPTPAPIPAPAPAPGPVSNAEEEAIKKFASTATAQVPVLQVQHTLMVMGPLGTPKYPNVQATGVWDGPTQDAFVDSFFTAPARALITKAIPKLLSADNRTLSMLPSQTVVTNKGEAEWQARQLVPAPVPAPEPGPYPTPTPPGPVYPPNPEPGPTPGPVGPGPTPFYDTPAPEPGPSPEPGPTPEPAPAPTVDPAQVWSDAVAALVSATQKAEIYENGIAAAAADKAPALQSSYAEWAKSLDRVKSRIADLIEGSAQLQSAIDAGGGTPVAAGVSELEAFFEAVSGESAKVIALLRAPLLEAAPAAAPAPGVQGFAQVAQAAGLAARLAGPAWRGLLALLQTKTVATTAGAAVITSGATQVLGGDTSAYWEREKALDEMMASGELSPEDRKRLEGDKPFSPMVIATLGLVAVGGLALYLKNRPKRPGG